MKIKRYRNMISAKAGAEPVVATVRRARLASPSVWTKISWSGLSIRCMKPEGGNYSDLDQSGLAGNTFNIGTASLAETLRRVIKEDACATDLILNSLKHCTPLPLPYTASWPPCGRVPR